jgi:hypothetical protein
MVIERGMILVPAQVNLGAIIEVIFVSLIQEHRLETSITP